MAVLKFKCSTCMHTVQALAKPGTCSKCGSAMMFEVVGD